MNNMSVTVVMLIFTCISSVITHDCRLYIDGKGICYKATCKNKNLTEVPTDLPGSIQELELQDNIISEITQDSFSNYTELKAINLDRNDISSVQNKSFGNLTNLETLSIAKNLINISDNNGKNILENINVKYLDIGEQKFDIHQLNFKYPDKLFQRLTKLQSLVFDLYEKPSFGPGFKTMNLKSVSFRQCNIKSLQASTFNNLPVSVSVIHFTGCKQLVNISTIPDNVFSHFPNLTQIDLSWTNVSLIKGLRLLLPFQNKRMEKIDLGHMKSGRETSQLSNAVILSANMTKYLLTICVETLILCDNNIVDILPKTFLSDSFLKCLKYIDMSGNRFGLATLAQDLSLYGQNLYKLKAFDFSYLLIAFQNEQYLKFPLKGTVKEVVEYNTMKRDIKYCARQQGTPFYMFFPRTLSYIRFTHVIGAPDLEDLILTNTYNLTHVDISYFRLRCFPNVNFVNNSENNLEFLDISGIECWRYYNKRSIPLFHKLKTLIMSEVEYHRAINDHKNPLINAPNVEYLDLSWNGLWNIPTGHFSHLTKLRILKLCNNHFRVIPEDITSLKNLIYLNMKDNQLYTIPSNLTKWFDSQFEKRRNFTLKIQLNDFYCSCNEQEFVRWLNSTDIKLDKNRNYRCRFQNLQYKNTNDAINHFHDIFSDCQATSWLRLGIVLVTSFLTTVLPVAVIYNFRWRITFFCFRKFRKIVEGSMNLSYQYDVYVSYGYNGLPWIKEVLIQHLETDWKLNACIEDRDFTAGGSCAEQIASAIAGSRALIFVLTSDFMSKPFASYEIDRAIVAKTSRSLQNIIIVTLDSNIEDIPPELQSIWSDVSAIEWPKRNEDIQPAIDKLKTRLLLNF